MDNHEEARAFFAPIEDAVAQACHNVIMLGHRYGFEASRMRNTLRLEMGIQAHLDFRRHSFVFGMVWGQPALFRFMGVRVYQARELPIEEWRVVSPMLDPLDG